MHLSPHWIRVGPNPNITDVLVRKESKDSDTDTQDEHHVIMEAEIRMIHFQAEECQESPATARTRGSHWTDSLLELSEHGPVAALISDFWPPKLRENNSLLFETSHFVVFCYNRPGKIM